MQLAEQLEAMCLERSLEVETEQNYKRSLKFFSTWLGHQATISDLDEVTISRWLKSMDGNKASRTILGHKRSLTNIWNWMADRGLIRRYEVRRLRTVAIEPVIPNAWSKENVRRLLNAAEDLPGKMRNGVFAKDLMKAWIWIAYESGLRPGDMRRLRASNLNGNELSLVQHKTKVVHSCGLSPEAVKAVKAIARDSELLFPASRNSIRRWELRLFNHAQAFGFARRRGQGLGTLRKTHGTEVCRSYGVEAAARSLGHVSGTEIAKTYYIAPDALPKPMSPPGLHDESEAHQRKRRPRSSNKRAS